MSIQGFIKKLKDIMRGDAGVDGDAQRLSQMVWILFLKVFDIREQELELYEDEDYIPIIPIGYRWRDWAAPMTDDGKPDVKNQITGDELIEFVDNNLLPALRGDLVRFDDGKESVVFTSTDDRALIVKEFMIDTNNYMKNGILLRQVINLFNEINLLSAEDQHDFNDVYETLLKGLQSAGSAGEFYTPRAVTQFCVDHVNPVLGEKIADFACGTGGFLIDALEHIKKQAKTNEDLEKIQKALHGVEKKPLPYMLGTTNLLLHGINLPDIIYGNSLEQNVRDYTDKDKYDVILMNPPYGGKEQTNIQSNFPSDLRSAETADLFMIEILYRLKENGRVAVVLPDGFLFGTGNKNEIKKRLLKETNLHTIIRLPKSVFAPYTSINTNLLFFDKVGTTSETWFYRLDLPENYKAFSKTRPMMRNHLSEVDQWWENRKEIKDVNTNTYKSQKVSIEEFIKNDYDLSFCDYPVEEELVLSPEETIEDYISKRDKYINNMDKQISILKSILRDDCVSSANFNISKLEENEIYLKELDENLAVTLQKSIINEAMQGKLVNHDEFEEEIDVILSNIKDRKNNLVKKKEIKSRPKPNKIDLDITPFDIPDHWRWVRFGDIVEFSMGKTPPRAEPIHWGDDVSWSSIADIDSKLLNTTKEKVSRYAIDNSFGGQVSPKGTLIMSFKLSIGKTAILDIDAVHNEAIISIYPFLDKNNALRDYLLYILPVVSLWGDSKSAVKGKTLNSTSINNLIIPFPPFNEQRKIANKLELLLNKKILTD